ncbi:hypothetical protein C7B80_31220 [Cyanosarcina cf. burmensis CCALA 770]|nr:hypothetical protein C7B80_31220 [Cyanosarcina cf. burmensis CCALA 770]
MEVGIQQIICTSHQLPTTNYQQPITNYQLPITTLISPLLNALQDRPQVQIARLSILLKIPRL